jgi:hypothetical protein
LYPLPLLSYTAGSIELPQGVSVTTPTAIIDKNGKHTTVHRNNDVADSATPSRVSELAPSIQTVQEPFVEFDTDPLELEAFTSGDCWLLAATAEGEFGWEAVAVMVPEGIDEGAPWMHMVNRLPDGRLIDIEGIHTEKGLLSRWGGDHLEPAKPFLSELSGVEPEFDIEPLEVAYGLHETAEKHTDIEPLY